MSPRGTGTFMDGLLGMAKSTAAGKLWFIVVQ